MYYLAHLTQKTAPVGGMVGAEPSAVVIVEGAQKLTPASNDLIATFFANMFMGAADPPAEVDPRTRYALPCPQAQVAGGKCEVSALANLATRPLGSTVVVDYKSASAAGGVAFIIATTQAEVKELAKPDSNLAVFEPDLSIERAKEGAKKEDDYTAWYIGAAAGAAVGFAAAGPVGAAVGAGSGFVVAKWLT